MNPQLVIKKLKMKYLNSWKLLSMFLITFFVQKTYNQNLNGQIIYSAEFKTDKGMPSTIKLDKILYALSFSNNESIFKKQDVLLNDNKGKLDLVTIFAGNGIFYTNVSSNERINQKEYYGELFLIDTPLINWTLTQEKKMIGKYSCFKATAVKYIKNRKGIVKEREVTAWYTPQISMNYGPKEYNNLPGLILELQEGNLTFLAIKIELDIDSLIINKPKAGKKVTLEGYEDIVKKMTQDFIQKH